MRIPHVLGNTGRVLCGWSEDSEVAIARQETREKAFTRMVAMRTYWAGTV